MNTSGWVVFAAAFAGGFVLVGTLVTIVKLLYRIERRLDQLIGENKRDK